MKQAWRSYVESDGSLKDGNINALMILLKILAMVSQQFIIRQQQKLEKKTKQAIQQAAKGESSLSKQPSSIEPLGRQGSRKAKSTQDMDAHMLSSRY